LIDLQILLSYARKPLNLPARGIEDYTVLIPLYNSPRYFKNKIFTDTIKDRTILCVSTSNAEMERFAGEMEQDGYSVIRIKENSESPWHVLRLALNPQLILLQEALLWYLQDTWCSLTGIPCRNRTWGEPARRLTELVTTLHP